jgi:hypothetical protein
MGTAHSKTPAFEEHLLWIEENHAFHEPTVSNFRRSVARTSPWYSNVKELFRWQRPDCTDDEHVADLVREMRIAIQSVKVNKVDVF